MPYAYHDGSRSLQERFDTRRLADRLSETVVHHAIDAHDRSFLARMDMFFLATADEHGHPSCSYKGGEPGFIRVVDDHTVAFPNYDGNGMYVSMGNLLRNPHVGMLFIDFEKRHRMRINGEASISEDDELMREFPEAQFIVRVKVSEVFPNCPRYIHRYKLVRRSRFVPKKGETTPVPEWKKGDWVCDTLPNADPARDPGAEVLDA